MSRPAERVVAFYNKRGTCEQWIKEGVRPKCQGKWPDQLLTHRFGLSTLRQRSAPPACLART
jgi:hypothetical protein